MDGQTQFRFGQFFARVARDTITGNNGIKTQTPFKVKEKMGH